MDVLHARCPFFDAGMDVVHAGCPFFLAGMDTLLAGWTFLFEGMDILHAGRTFFESEKDAMHAPRPVIAADGHWIGLLGTHRRCDGSCGQGTWTWPVQRRIRKGWPPTCRKGADRTSIP